jgi:hypothetical protein
MGCERRAAGPVSLRRRKSGNQILFRAERAGTGNGWVYVVHFIASASGVSLLF